MVAERLAGVREAGNLVEHGGRYVYVERVEAELVEGVRGWVYLCLDMQTRGREQRRPYAGAARKGLSPEEVHGRMERMGVFVLAAARNQKCKVYDAKVITCEPTSAANGLYRAIGEACPVEIPLDRGKN